MLYFFRRIYMYFCMTRLFLDTIVFFRVRDEAEICYKTSIHDP